MMMIVGAAAILASSTVRSALGALWSTSTYLATMRHHTLHQELESLDLKATLEMVEHTLQIMPKQKNTRFGMHMVHTTCNEIQNTLDIVYKKIEAHQTTWVSKRLWNCDCTYEMERLRMLNNRLRQRFELLANMVKLTH